MSPGGAILTSLQQSDPCQYRHLLPGFFGVPGSSHLLWLPWDDATPAHAQEFSHPSLFFRPLAGIGGGVWVVVVYYLPLLLVF